MLYDAQPAGFIRPALNHGPYSPSRLLVAKCPARFFGQYIRKDKSIGHSSNAARGSAIHDVFSKITAAHRDGERLNPVLVSRWVNEAVGLFPAAYEQIDLIKCAADAYIGNPCPYMSKNTECEKAFAVEYHEEASFDDAATLKKAYVQAPYADENGFPNKDAFFGGRLDFIDVDPIGKIIVIVDHKTTPSANKNEDHIFQMGAYAWLVSLYYPGYQIKTVIHYAHPDLNFYGKPQYWSKDELSAMEWYIHNRVFTIEHFSEFPALPGDACGYCHMVQECPDYLALSEQRARGPIDMNVRSFADLERLAKQLRVVGVLYDELNKALKTGVEVHAPRGGVSIDGLTYGFKSMDESVDWVCTDLKIREDSAKAKVMLLEHANEITPEQKAKFEKQMAIPDLGALLKAFKIDPDMFKDWQAQKLKQIWRLDKPGLLEMLKEYIVKDKTTRFGGHKNW